jgi:hypothetical protein
VVGADEVGGGAGTVKLFSGCPWRLTLVAELPPESTTEELEVVELRG